MDRIAQLKDTYPLIAYRINQTPAEDLVPALRKANKMLNYRASKNLSTELISVTVNLLNDRLLSL
jgi:hypothetical protein